MKVLGIIPSRFGSTRFPGKPLAIIHGKSMIERVYSCALKSRLLTELVVATDDQRIFDHVISFGGKVMMTSSSHPSGTDRCAEVLQKSTTQFDVVINIQGDEPFINYEQIDQLINCFTTPETEIATLIKVIDSLAELQNQNIPKVVVNYRNEALYFSRSMIPYCSNERLQEMIDKGKFYKHIGIYGYSAQVLAQLTKLDRGLLEEMESLEQLRWLENGYKIITAVTGHENFAIDVPGDIALAETRFSANV